MTYLDIDQLNAQFAATDLTYKDASGATVTLPDTQRLVENGPDEDLDDTQPFVRWTISPGDSVADTTGIITYKNLGTATLQIFIPKGQGATKATDIRNAFEASFRDWRSDDLCLRVYKLSASKGNDPKFLQVNATLFYKSLRMIGPEGNLLNLSQPANSQYAALL